MKNRMADLAAGLLLAQNRHSLPVNPLKLKLPYKVIIDTLEHYACNSKATLQELKAFSDLNDGITIKRNDIIVILYNSQIASSNRIAFTIAHEIGHILLNHSTDEKHEESEADYFAAELLMPRVLVKETLAKNPGITFYEFSHIFGVSHSTSQVRMRECAEDFVVSKSENALLQRYKAFLPVSGNPITTVN